MSIALRTAGIRGGTPLTTCVAHGHTISLREVWFWKDGRIAVHVLRRDCYELVDRSPRFSDLDLGLLCCFWIDPQRCRPFEGSAKLLASVENSGLS